jgi:carboxyl-terminal processing protease
MGRVARWLILLAIGAGVVLGARWALPRVPAIYIRSALSIIEERAYYRDRVDWNQVRRDALSLADASWTPRDTYPAIRHTLAALGDHHSFLSPPLSKSDIQAQVMRNSPPTARDLGGRVGYVELPSLPGPSEYLGDGRSYASAVHAEIAQVAATGPQCGWVVDLRRDAGGMGWPMLAGIGPVLGEGELGAWIFRGGVRATWSYRGGQARNGGPVVAAVATPYRLENPNVPVAVLIGSKTASAGEFIAIAFKGRPSTRFFGQPTAGVSTGNTGIRLADGASLFLTVALGADRTGRIYDGAVIPDTLVPFEFTEIGTGKDPVIGAAVEWLRTQSGCESATGLERGGER